MGSEGQIVDLLPSMAELSNMEMDWGIYLSQASAYRYVALCQNWQSQAGGLEPFLFA
jgi:hypothetical protein